MRAALPRLREPGEAIWGLAVCGVPEERGLPFPEEAPRGRRRRRRGDGEAETVGAREGGSDNATDSDATVCDATDSDATESDSTKEEPPTAHPPSIFGGPRNADWETDVFTCKAWARGRNKYKS